jgi:hypothetical protein
LAHFAGTRLNHAEAVGIKPNRREIEISGAPSGNFLFVSPDIAPAIDDISGAKPMP